MGELLRKKSIRAGLLAIVLIVVVGIAGINVQSAQRRKEYNSHVEAAEKYLIELDYEQAIAQYNMALEIEPKSEEVLSGLEQAYLAYARRLVDAGDYERAGSLLEEGYEMTGRESLLEKLREMAGEVHSNIYWLKAGMQHIPDKQLEASINWAIYIMETYEYFDKASLARLYYWAGERGLSEEYWKEYDGEGGLEKTEEGFIHEDDTIQEGPKPVNTWDRYCMQTGSKTVFTEDGSFSEFIKEHDESGRLVREVHLMECNSLDATEAVMAGISDSYYEVERRESTEYEYDALGRVVKVTRSRKSVYSDGEMNESYDESTFTYHDDSRFTKEYYEEVFHNGAKDYDQSWFVDSEIVDRYGKWKDGEAYDMTRHNY